MAMKKVLHMNAGDEETSYATNSGIQKLVMFKTWPVLEETLKQMLDDFEDNSFPKLLRIVDLGCSSGPNTLFAIQCIMDTVEKLFKDKDFYESPEIEVFLNDLPNNDFNNLFKLLPSLYKENCNTSPKWFLNGLPGSFYARLFPSKSLHFAFSCWSIHWLSQVPEGLENKNKENIYIATTSPHEVIDVYAKQYQKDFSTFLRFRAKEMISGGRMVLTFIGRRVEDPCCKDDTDITTLLAATLVDMVAEGLVRMDDLHSFNLPIYFPCKEEVKKIVEKEGSFTLEKLHVFQVGWDATFGSKNQDQRVEQGDEDTFVSFRSNFDKYRSGKVASDSIRAVLEPMLATHFGLEGSIFDRMFKIYGEKVGEHLSLQKSSYFNIVVSLSRN